MRCSKVEHLIGMDPSLPSSHRLERYTGIAVGGMFRTKCVVSRSKKQVSSVGQWRHLFLNGGYSQLGYCGSRKMLIERLD
jgi:hypothetical protein